MFFGTTILPLRKALPTAAFCTGSLRRFSVPVPMVLFLTKLGEVPFFTKVVDAPFLTSGVDGPFFTNLLALPAGLWTRGCAARDGARCTLRDTDRPLTAASLGVASNSVRATTAATTADTTMVVLISVAPCFPPEG